MKKVAIHQSQYMPWPPYFKKIAMADVFVMMDNVQYQKNGVQNRNLIRNKDAEFWLTIPVSGQLTDSIAEKRIASDQWRKKHWKSIQSAYHNAPQWYALAEQLNAYFQANYETLHEANDALLRLLFGYVGIQTSIVYLSELQAEGSKSELVLNTCRLLDADVYLSGWGSKGYLNEASFEDAGITIDYVESVSPRYVQFHGEFIRGLSIIDMLMNEELSQVKQYLFGDL